MAQGRSARAINRKQNLLLTVWTEKTRLIRHISTVCQMHQRCSVHSTPEKFEHATITGNFEFVFEENSVRKSQHYRYVIALKKISFQTFSVHTKTQIKASVCKFLRFEYRLRNAPLIFATDFNSVYDRPNRRDKAAFSNFSSVEMTRPKMYEHYSEGK